MAHFSVFLVKKKKRPAFVPRPRSKEYRVFFPCRVCMVCVCCVFSRQLRYYPGECAHRARPLVGALPALTVFVIFMVVYLNVFRSVHCFTAVLGSFVPGAWGSTYYIHIVFSCCGVTSAMIKLGQSAERANEQQGLYNEACVLIGGLFHPCSFCTCRTCRLHTARG